MTTYVEDALARLLAMSDDIHALLQKTSNAVSYRTFVSNEYPYWKWIDGETRLSADSAGSQIRTHTFLGEWTLGVVSAGEPGVLEENAHIWKVTAMDFIQSHPSLTSSDYATETRWLYGEGAFLTTVSGVLYSPVNQDTISRDTKQTAYIHFVLEAPFRVVVQRS